MTILVTGGNGQLGTALRLASAKSHNRYIFTDIEELDITSAKAVEKFFEGEKVDVVVNCAAYTAVDLAEEERKKVFEINCGAVINLAEQCQKHNATLIHISTDYIFSGEKHEPYTEQDTPDPVNAYGRSKLAGEIAVVNSGCKHIILRTSWLYSEFGHNFVKTMRSLTATRPEIKVVADQFGTPTYAGDLANTIVAIIESGLKDRCGAYNYSNIGECSWYDFAIEIARLSGNKECKITPCATAGYPTKAQRPQYSVLDKSKFLATFGIAIPEWQESLAECIKRLNNE